MNISVKLLHGQQRSKLQLLVASVAHWRVYGQFPRRSRVARILIIDHDRATRLVRTLEIWGLVRVSRRLTVVVTERGFEALEELLGYSPERFSRSSVQLSPELARWLVESKRVGCADQGISGHSPEDGKGAGVGIVDELDAPFGAPPVDSRVIPSWIACAASAPSAVCTSATISGGIGTPLADIFDRIR